MRRKIATICQYAAAISLALVALFLVLWCLPQVIGGVAMTDLIPVTVIEHQGPFPPTAYDLYYIDRTRNIIWIPYAEWWMKEEGK